MKSKRGFNPLLTYESDFFESVIMLRKVSLSTHSKLNKVKKIFKLFYLALRSIDLISSKNF